MSSRRAPQRINSAEHASSSFTEISWLKRDTTTAKRRPLASSELS